LPLENNYNLEIENHLLPSVKSIHLQFEGIITIWGKLTLNADASPKNPLLLFFNQEDVCKNLIESLSGLKETLSSTIMVNGIPCTQKSLIALRKHSLLIREPQWFAGTIYQNLVLNHRNVAMDYLCGLLKKLNLLEKVMSCPEGLNTLVHDWQTAFTLAELIQLMIVRAIIDKPRLLIIDRSLDELLVEELDGVLSLLLALDNTTLVITTLKTQIQQLPNRLAVTL